MKNEAFAQLSAASKVPGDNFKIVKSSTHWGRSLKRTWDLQNRICYSLPCREGLDPQLSFYPSFDGISMIFFGCTIENLHGMEEVTYTLPFPLPLTRVMADASNMLLALDVATHQLQPGWGVHQKVSPCCFGPLRQTEDLRNALMQSLVKWKLKTTSAWGDDLESEDEGDAEGPLPKGPKGWQSMVFAAAVHNLCVSFFWRIAFVGQPSSRINIYIHMY